MALDKQDLKEIKKIVDGSIEKAIEKSEVKMSDKIEFLIEKSELRMEDKMEVVVGKAKEEILEKMGNEISSLSDINRAVITRNDEFDYRLRIVERKLGIKS